MSKKTIIEQMSEYYGQYNSAWMKLQAAIGKAESEDNERNNIESSDL